MAPERHPQSIDSLLEALADERRRAVVRYLSEASNDAASVSHLADHLLEHCEAANDPENVAVHLHHVSLPKLEDAGLVEFDARRHRVEYLPNPRAEELLGTIEERREAP